MFLLFVSLKYDVGTDSLNYLNHYKDVSYDIYEFGTYDFDFPQIAYASINIIASKINGGMLFVYSVSSVIIVFSLFKACSIVGINPFLYLTIIFPAHFVMLSVSGIRQGVAASLIILAYSYLLIGKKWLALSIVLFATMFHTSAIILTTILMIGIKRKYIILISPILLFILVYLSFSVYGKYLDSDMSNIGLILRYGFYGCIVFVIKFIMSIINTKIDTIDKHHIYYYYLFFIAIGAVSLLSSTLSDRLSFYFISLSAYFLIFLCSKYNISNLLKYHVNLLLLGSFITLVVFCFFGNNTSNYTYDNYIYRYIVDGKFPTIDSRIKARGGYLPGSAEPY